MNILLTSCGLETEKITKAFLDMLPKSPAAVRALFIPTAANTPDAIEVLPKCLHDLLKCAVKRENICVYDLHDRFDGEIGGLYDVVYICGGDPHYLLRRIREGGFEQKLLAYVKQGGMVVGVSAGSMIFAKDMPENLGVLQCALQVHCSSETCEEAGRYSRDRQETIKLGNTQAILCRGDCLEIIE